MILVLEDEALVAMDIEMTLTDAGHKNVVVCHDVDMAMQRIKNIKPRFAVLDFNLGNDTTSLAVARYLIGVHVPFVFLTGYTDAAGAIPTEFSTITCVTKPFHSTDLTDILASFLASE